MTPVIPIESLSRVKRSLWSSLSCTLWRVIDRSIVGGIRSIRSSKSWFRSTHGSEHSPSPEKWMSKSGEKTRERMQRSARRVLSLCGFQRKFPSATRKVNRRDPVVRFYADHIWLAPCQNEENVFFLALSARLWVRLHSFRRHASDKRLPPSLFCLYTEVVNWFGRNDDKKKVSILILRPLAYFVHSTIKHFLLSYSFSYVDVSPSLVYLGNYAWAFLRHFKRARVKVEDMIFFLF